MSVPASLPSGRHGLPRTFVMANQRRRLLDATVDAVFSVGFLALTVREVVARAGVSRRTFYEYFEDLEDCFLQTLDDLLDDVADVIVARAHDPAAAIAAAIDAVLEHPAEAQLLLVEIRVAGGRAARRRDRLVAGIVDSLAASSSACDRLVAECAVEALAGLLASRIVNNRVHELPGLLGGLQQVLAHRGAAARRTA